MYCNACGKDIAEDCPLLLLLRQSSGDSAHAEETDALPRR